MKRKLIIVTVFDKIAEHEVKKAINDLNIKVVEETTKLECGITDILTLMTEEQALTMLDVTNNIDVLMIEGEE